jgi:hypothetical protein
MDGTGRCHTTRVTADRNRSFRSPAEHPRPLETFAVSPDLDYPRQAHRGVWITHSHASTAACKKDRSRSLIAFQGVDQIEPTIEDAIALAARLHRGARYPSPEAEPYIFHALRVMLQFADPVDQMAAVLHDVVEDTEITLNILRDSGYRPEVVDAIDALTHHSRDSYEHYIEGVARNPVARRIKIIDLKENLANNRRSPLALRNVDRIRRYETALDRLRIR